jgi:hypothetical protein
MTNDPRPRCTARSKRTGEHCRGWAMVGQTVCRMHGGAAAQNRQAAERRQQEAQAEAAVIAYGLPREVDAHTALLEELWRTAGHVAWLSLQVQQMQDHELHVRVGGGEMSEPRQEAHIWIRLYQEERKHLAGVARDCIKAGIEERRIKLAEDQAELIATYTRALLSELGIDPTSEKARKAMRNQLTVIAGGMV